MKQTFLAVLLILCAALCCGCGAPDAAELLEGSLELVYRGSCSDQYRKAAGLTDEDARRQYEAGIDAELAVFAAWFDVDLALCGDEATEKLRAFYRTVYSHIQYEAGKPVKDGDGYTVDLTVYPVDILQKFREEALPALMADWQARYQKGEFDAMSDAEYEEAWVSAILSALAPRLQSIGHLAGETVTVRFARAAESGLYIVPGELARIDELVLAY